MMQPRDGMGCPMMGMLGGDRIEFRSYNIASQEGQAWAKQYNLLVHPAYVLLDREGEQRWKGAGALPKATIEAELLAVLR